MIFFVKLTNNLMICPISGIKSEITAMIKIKLNKFKA